MPSALCRLSLAALLLAAPTPSQGPPAGPETADLLTELQAARAAGQRDRALTILWRAEAANRRDGDASRSARHRAVLGEMRLALDPHGAARRTRDTAAAESLVKLARSYQRKKWWRRALSLLESAAQLDPEVAAKPLDYVRKRAQSAAAARAAARNLEAASTGADEAPGSMLAELRTTFVGGLWDLNDVEVRSPPRPDGATKLVVCSEPRHEDNRIEVEVLIGDRPGSGALMFAARGTENYYLIELAHVKDVRDPRRVERTDVALYHYTGGGGKLESLAASEVRLTAAQRGDWLTIGVTIDGPVVTLEFEERPVARAQCPTIPHGGVGFFVSGNTDNPDPVRFRNLQIGPPTAREAAAPAAPAQAAPSRPTALQLLTTALEEAEALVEDDPEAAALQAWALRRAAASRLPARTDRDAFRSACDALIGKADPVDRQAYRTLTELATSLVTLAASYRESELPLAAESMLARAAASDEPSTDAELDRLRPQLDALRAARIAAEREARSADRRQLAEWFQGGKQLFSSGGWTVSETIGARSPQLEKGSTLLLARPATPAAVRASVRLSLDGIEDRSAGLGFGVRGTNGFNLAVVHRYGDVVEVELLEWKGSTWRPLGKQGARIPALSGKEGEAEFILDLHIDAAGTVQASVRGGPKLRYERRDLTLAGQLALYAENRGDEPAQQSFGGFSLEKPEDAPAAGAGK